MKAVWAPTAAHHSGMNIITKNVQLLKEIFFPGQLSDSACGTLKRGIKNDLKSGKGIILLNFGYTP